jgi:hypothetical protein
LVPIGDHGFDGLSLEGDFLIEHGVGSLTIWCSNSYGLVPFGPLGSVIPALR